MSRNRADYTIITGRSIGEIIPIVRRFMFDGWLPSGPIVPDHKHYLQAMIKVEA